MVNAHKSAGSSFENLVAPSLSHLLSPLISSPSYNKKNMGMLGFRHYAGPVTWHDAFRQNVGQARVLSKSVCLSLRDKLHPFSLPSHCSSEEASWSLLLSLFLRSLSLNKKPLHVSSVTWHQILHASIMCSV